MKVSDFTGQIPHLTYVPATAAPGSVVVLYNKVDRCSVLLTEGQASGSTKTIQA